MNVTPYWQKLQDPRWQRKRLEIMERAQFACEECGETKSQLHIHHRLYRKGAEPWEYENGVLLCLCTDCHKRLHKWKQAFDEDLLLIGDDCYIRAVVRGLATQDPSLIAYAIKGFAAELRYITELNKDLDAHFATLKD
jgi:hypothetical protein